MIAMTSAEIATVVSGRLVGEDVSIDGPVQTDTREPLTNGVFVAKPGEQADGHDFLPQAISAGAAVAIVEHLVPGVSIPQVVVADAVTALSMLARHVVAQCRKHGALKHVIGVTGSAGKTTTKLILGHILESVGNTVIPERSFNNEVGAPTTMLKTALDTEYLVVEMGATHKGNIAWLCSLAKPDIGIVLQVGMAHVGEFGSQAQIAATKAEMVEDLPADGVAILNADDPLVAPMAAKTIANVVTFGSSGKDIKISNPVQLASSIEFDLAMAGESHPISMHLLGVHNAWNAAAAAAAALACGVQPAIVVARLESLPHGERWRMQVTDRPDGVTIINDAYNASPDAMGAALRTLAAVSSTTKRRSVAVLGAMGELGDLSEQAHAQLGEQVVRLNIGLLVVIGEGARALYQSAILEGSWGAEAVYFGTADEAQEWLRQNLKEGDIVLVKSSNAAGLRLLGDQLAEGTCAH